MLFLMCVIDQWTTRLTLLQSFQIY